MDANQLVVNVLVLVASGATSVLVGLIFRRLGDIATDVKEIRDQVGDHAERLASSGARIDQLRKDVDGLLERERMRRASGV